MRAIAIGLCLVLGTAANAIQKVGGHYRLAVINRTTPLVTKDKTAALILAKWRHYTSIQAQYGGKDIGMYSEDARKTSLRAVELKRGNTLIPVPYNSIVTLLAQNTVPQSDRDTDDSLDLFQVRFDSGKLRGQTFWTADVVDHDVPLNGDPAILTNPKGDQVLCALTDDDMSEYKKVEAVGKKDLMNGMVKLGRCFYVKNGTHGVFAGLEQVRITEGPHKGTLVFAEHASLESDPIHQKQATRKVSKARRG